MASRASGNVVWIVTLMVGLIAIGNVIFSAGVQSRDLRAVAEANARQDENMQALGARQSSDHDCLTELKGDVKHIKETTDRIDRMLTEAK